MPNQPFNQPFNGQMVHGQMITNGCNQQQMVHPQHKALLTPSPSANLTAGKNYLVYFYYKYIYHKIFLFILSYPVQ